MPITITHRLSSGTNTDGSPTTGSISVTAGDLLVAIISSGSVAGATNEPTGFGGTLGSTLTWTKRGSVQMNSSGRGHTSVWTAPCPSSASGTAIITFPGTNTSNSQWTFVTLTGVDPTNPVRQVKTGQMASTNPSIILDQTPLTNSIVIAALHMNTNTTPTAGTGKTMIGTTFVGTSPSVVQGVEYDIGSATASTAFVSPSTANKGMIAIEFQEPVSFEPKGDVIIGGSLKKMVSESVIIGGVKKALVNQWVVIGGAKKSLVWSAGAEGPDLIAALPTPFYAAHRGGGGEWPEDTPYAFSQAALLGSDVVLEGDLWVNASGSLVLMHDSTVDRTTTSTGAVSSFTDAAWASVTVDIGPGAPRPAGFYTTNILNVFTNNVLMMETSGSSSAVAAHVALKASYPSLTNRVIAQAFNRGYCDTYVAAGFYTMQIYGTGVVDFADDAARGIWGVGLDYAQATFTQANVNIAKGLGLKVVVYGIDNITQRNIALGYGVDGLMTDFPTTIIP